ncbi:MAG: glycosyltransferase [Balneolaceae bacterium]
MNSRTDIHIGLLAATLDGGGAERMLVNLANSLIQKRALVTLYLVNKKGPFLTEVSDDVQIADLHAKYGVKSVFLKLRKILKQNRPDIIISTQPHVNTILGLAGIGLSHKPVLVFREANTPSVKYSDYGFFPRWVYKKSHTLADHYIAVSDGVKQDMTGYYGLDPAKVTRIYNPLIDETVYDKAREAADHPWVTGEHNLIMAMGRVVPQKDYMTLIRAFSLMKKPPEARLLILGETENDNAYTARIRELIDQLGLQDSVELGGFKNNPFSYLSKASLFVLSSRFEGLPGSLVQAMACGCRVVSTDCPSGPAEILEEGKYGRLVPVGDEEALAQAMAASLDEQHNPQKVIKRAEEYSVEKSVQEYISLIHYLLESQQK